MSVEDFPAHRIKRVPVNLPFDPVTGEPTTETVAVEVEPSCGCVFCDLNLKPTNCTDGWWHLMSDGRTVKCAIKN